MSAPQTPKNVNTVLDSCQRDILGENLKGTVLIKHGDVFSFRIFGMGDGETLDLLNDMRKCLTERIKKSL